LKYLAKSEKDDLAFKTPKFENDNLKGDNI
jgi:hypothetical protein